MTTREDILSLAVPVLWQAWRSNDWEAEDNPDWVEFDDEESARAWGLACLFNGVRPLYAAPTSPAAEAPGQEPVAVKPLEWKPFTDREGDLEARTSLGRYMIRPSVGAGRFRLWCPGDREPSVYPNAHEAHAAAQSRHDEVVSALVSAPPTSADAEAKGLRELQDWVMAERIALVPLDPDFMPKHTTLKAVGKKIRDMLAIRSLASPAPKGET